jgi:hypothetical protein
MNADIGYHYSKESLWQRNNAAQGKKKQQKKVPPNEKKNQKQSVTDAGREPPAD